jgi:hypothetical protein
MVASRDCGLAAAQPASELHASDPYEACTCTKVPFPRLLAWLAAIAVHAGVIWLVAPPL